MSERLVQDDKTNIEISIGEGGQEELNISLVPSSVEQFSTLDLMC